MAFTRKCPKCGFELTDAAARVCPLCGSSIVGLVGGKIWIGALIQFTIATVFMLALGFPKFMIAIFGVMILVGTVISAWAKAKPPVMRPAVQRPVKNPVRFKVLSLSIAVCSLVFACTLLFGFVTFINSWNRWHRYEGQPCHVSELQVDRVYFQRGSKGGVDAYARGTVEGQREWMDLIPYLHFVPRTEAELESRVPPGTIIPIYYFPAMKGRSRAQVYEDTPPAEASHRTAVNAANYGLLGLIVTAGVIFVLARLRKACYVEDAASFVTLG
jgi:hypothetical protein